MLQFLNNMHELPSTFPEVYAAFCNSEFSVQMSHSNLFVRNEADKTTENTINRDCKTGGGCIGFSASFSATQRWFLNASRRAKYRQLIREHLAMKPEGYVHKASHLKKDETAVENVKDVLDNVMAKPWNGRDLQSLSTGIVALDTIKENLLNARKYGQLACKDFINNRCITSPETDFHDPMQKTNLQTFKSLKTGHESECKRFTCSPQDG